MYRISKRQHEHSILFQCPIRVREQAGEGECGPSGSVGSPHRIVRDGRDERGAEATSGAYPFHIQPLEDDRRPKGALEGAGGGAKSLRAPVESSTASTDRSPGRLRVHICNALSLNHL